MKLHMIALLVLVGGLASGAVPDGNLSGIWDAQVTVNQLEIPFRLELNQEGGSARGWFFNGDDKVTSTSGRFENGQLVLDFDHYAAHLTATLKNGALEGRYTRAKNSYPFKAEPAKAVTPTAGQVPHLAAEYEIPTKSAKGENAWRFLVRQSGDEVSATILRVDGDTGTLTGRFADGQFVLSHFSGARPSLLTVTPKADGTLDLVLNGKSALTAVPVAQARAEGLPEPTDPSRHTTVKDPSEPLHFSGADLTGKLVTDADARFRGKVVLVNISGSWCPNCHDEAPVLAALYREYRGRGLEIVALSFEEAEQLEDPARLRAFVKQYGIEYTVLIPGEPADVAAKLPQAVNLNSWPTTFFLGRDGRVRATHAGFAGKATGSVHEEQIAEFRATIERLLQEGSASER